MDIDWNVALKIWAVIGPLVAGGASAVWSQRNQLRDREDERKQRDQARAGSLEDRRLEFNRGMLVTQKGELRATIAQFVATANEFIMACMDSRRGQNNEESIRHEREAGSRMNMHYQHLILLGTDELAKIATRILNLATDFPMSVADESEEKQKEHRDAYLVAKRELNRAARPILGIQLEG